MTIPLIETFTTVSVVTLYLCICMCLCTDPAQTTPESPDQGGGHAGKKPYDRGKGPSW